MIFLSLLLKTMINKLAEIICSYFKMNNKDDQFIINLTSDTFNIKTFNIKLNDQNLPNLNQQQYIRKSHNESKLKNRGFGFSNRLKNKENKF